MDQASGILMKKEKWVEIITIMSHKNLSLKVSQTQKFNFKISKNRLFYVKISLNIVWEAQEHLRKLPLELNSEVKGARRCECIFGAHFGKTFLPELRILREISRFFDRYLLLRGREDLFQSLVGCHCFHMCCLGMSGYLGL